MANLKTERNVELDALSVQRIVSTVVGRQSPEPGNDAKTAETQLVHATPKFTHSRHRAREVDRRDPRQASRMLANEGGYLVVVDQGALWAPPRCDQSDVDSRLVHRPDRRGQWNLRDGALPGPAAKRSEERLLEEAPSGVLHPDVDDSHAHDARA